jgi:hypothetical protein
VPTVPDKGKSVASADTKSEQVTRAQKIERNGGNPRFPDVGDADYVITYWHDLGVVESGGMGPIPLSSKEILSWQECTGVDLQAWEFRVLREMSRRYLIQSEESKKPECPPPFGDPVSEFDRGLVSKKVGNAFKAFIQAGSK